MESNNHFVLVSRRKAVADWLTESIRDEGDLIVAEHDHLDRTLQLLDAVGARLVFLELSQEQFSQDAAFMEGLTEAKPLLPVIAVSETGERSAILTALRAGARDFISPDMRPGEIISLIRRAMNREFHDVKKGQGTDGEITAVASARPGGDAPMFALHLALALQDTAPSERTLLLDLGLPAADTLHYLGITPTYTFVDAIRSLRRLDETLIDTAFAKHDSGLRILAMPEEDHPDTAHFTSADLFVLVGALKRHFAHIVVNLGGLPPSEFLYVMLGRAERTLLLVEQSVPSCKQNRTLLQRLRDNKIDMSGVSLIVDRYLPNAPPNADTIAKGFGITLRNTLPPSGMARLTMMNTGESLFRSAPRDPYTVTVRKIAQSIANESGLATDAGSATRKRASGGGLWGLLGKRQKTT